MAFHHFPCADLDFDDAELLPMYLNLIQSWTGLDPKVNQPEVNNSMIVRRALFDLEWQWEGPARVWVYDLSSEVMSKCMKVFEKKFGTKAENEFQFTFRHWFHRMAVMELVPRSEWERPPWNEVEMKHPLCFAVATWEDVTLEEMTPDFLDGLFVHDARRLEFEIENICGEPQRITRATTRLRLNYEQDVFPPLIAKENVTDSTVVPIVGYSIDLTTDEAVDEPCSPPDRQIIFIVPSQRVDLTAVVSPEANRCISTEWSRLSDLTKEVHESTYARKYLRGDVINAYIFEKFLQRSCKELFNMFYCSTFWFVKASQQVDAYDMTSHSESASIGIKRLKNAIYPQLCDGDFKVIPKS
ncbi:hypothetical protein R1flu_009038 [Riccia fluitans]|uniref:Uncharacterized protein n=1 Tax=Riccia fluitans TaxID=41844 RepID=A0ABD1Z0Y5_9MARC